MPREPDACRQSHAGLATEPRIEVATLPLGRAPGSAVALRPDRRLFARWWRWCVVDVAFCGHGGADAFGDDARHGDDSLNVTDAHPHLVARMNRLCRFHLVAVDAHVSGSAGGPRERPSLHQSHSPNPAVDPRTCDDGIHASTLRKRSRNAPYPASQSLNY